VQEKILKVSYNLFKTLGVRAVTIEYLCAQLGISKKTFYLYFENKDVLVDMVVSTKSLEHIKECKFAIEGAENAIDEVFQSMTHANKDLQNMNPIFLHDLNKYHHESYEKVMKQVVDLNHDIISDNIHRGIREGLYREGINIEILTVFRLQCMFMGFDQNVFPKDQFSLLDVTHQILENFLFGIATKEGFNTIQEYKKKYKNTL
jgi:TetR/AcrR family transcriptional regulator, cholesterol catabolism regulator